MSLTNIFLSPSKALIGVDTEAVDNKTGEFYSISKLLHIAHLNAIIAGRGTQGFFIALSSIVQGSPKLSASGDFDEVVKAFPEAFNGLYEAMVTAKPEGEEFNILENQEIVLAGWSNTMRRMRAVSFTRRSPADVLEVYEIEDPGWLCPWDEAWGEAPDGDDRETMLELIKQQVHHAKLANPSIGMGGRLTLVELTKDQMKFNLIDPEAESKPKLSAFPGHRVFGSAAMTAQ